MLTTTKLVVFTLFGALLIAGSNHSEASNVYSAAQSHDDEATTVAESQAHYWACPAEYKICPVEHPIVTARATDPFSTTDAPVVDTPEQAGWSMENEMRYYNYSRLIIGD